MEGVDELAVGPDVGEADEQPEKVWVGFEEELDDVWGAGELLAGLVPGAEEAEGEEDGGGGEEEVGGEGGCCAGDFVSCLGGMNGREGKEGKERGMRKERRRTA